MNLSEYEETFDVGAAQVTIEEVEDQAGVSYGMLKYYDHFVEGGEAWTQTLEGIRGGKKRRVRPLTSLGDIVV